MQHIVRERIYKHTQLDPKDAERIKPLMENAFNQEFGRYSHGASAGRGNIAAERKTFISEQFANRVRIAKNMGVNPLNEDAEIFGAAMPQLKPLFENAVIGMGDVLNPGSSSTLNGGIWNQGYKSGSGDLPSYIFGLQNHIALNCIGFDLMPTIAVDTPKCLITFIDTVYGGGTLDDTANMPTYLEFANSLFTRAWIKSKTLARATTELTLLASDGKAMKVRFMVGSTVKAAITAEVLATGTIVTTSGTPDTYAATWDNSVSVQTVAASINANANSLIFVGSLIAANVSAFATALTVGYASAIRTNIAEAASNNNTRGGMDRKQQEKGTTHKLNVIAMDKQLEMVGIEINADTSNIQIKDMAALGVNVISHLYTGVQNQLVQTLDEVILTHLYRMGVQHAKNVYDSQGENFSLYIDVPTTATKAMSAVDVIFEDMLGNDVRSSMGNLTNAIQSAAYENQMTHGERLYSRILLILEFVGQQNRIAPPDFIVAAGALASCLKKQSTFSACPVTTSFSANPELHYQGTIFETVSVYKNPKIDFTDSRILFGRRGDDKDPGSKFLAYDLAASRQTINPDNMAEKIKVWSRFQIADVGFYPELNYMTCVFINGYNWA